MTPDEQNQFAAIVIAHEHFLTMLLSFHFRRLSPEQRRDIERSMEEPPDLSSFHDLDLDIGQADDIAGLALLFRESSNRITRRAFALADDQAARGKG